jgi:hypothetical protein
MFFRQKTPAAPQRPAMLESLESRSLMSVTVPTLAAAGGTAQTMLPAVQQTANWSGTVQTVQIGSVRGFQWGV